MAFDFIFNELSLRAPTENAHQAREAMISFTNTLSALRKATSTLPFLPALRVHDEFPYAELAPGYNVAQWQSDHAVDPVRRSLLKSFAARGPHLRNLPAEVTDDFPTVFQYTLNAELCLGLGYAHLLRGLGISMAHDEFWDKPSVEISAHYLTAESEETFAVVVHHASKSEHVQENSAFIARRIDEYLDPVTTLEELWSRRGSLYPHLLFVEEVADQLQNLDFRQHLSGVMASLAYYDRYAAEWAETRSEFLHTKMPHVTPEHTTRVQLFGDQMTFAWKGVKRLFHYHGRFTPGPGRIHMWPDLEAKELVIGYIGRKIGI